MAGNSVKRTLLMKGEGGNYVCVTAEFNAGSISYSVPQEKGAPGHAEAVKAIAELSAELKEANVFHDAYECSLPSGNMVDRISIKRNVF